MTLAELLIVMVIIGLMAGIAVPRISDAMANRQASMAAKRVVADLELARHRAVQTSSSQTVKFGVNRYVLVDMEDPDRAISSYTVDLAEEPYNAQIVSVDFGGDDVLVFDVYGAADSGGTMVVRVGDWERIVTLDAVSGRATVE
jgi:hypothetical protein